MDHHHKFFAPSTIVECNSVRTVLSYCTFDTTAAFDIDNTLYRPTREEDLGSDQWFRKILERALQKIPQRAQALKSAIRLNNSVQQHLQIKPVETATVKIVQTLQDVGVSVIAVTARRFDIADITTDQLQRAGLNFEKDDLTIEFEVDGKKVVYQNKILFCDGANKGKCLVELMNQLKMSCHRLVMLDDNLGNLQDVSQAMKRKNIEFHGLRYNQLDQRVAQFDWKRANAKLSKYSLFFSASVADLVKDFELDGYPDTSLRHSLRASYSVD